MIEDQRNKVTFFRDGSQWCCVRKDFINIQESPVGFGDTAMEAMRALEAIEAAEPVGGNQ